MTEEFNDAGKGVYADPSKVHDINHSGDRYSVEGFNPIYAAGQGADAKGIPSGKPAREAVSHDDAGYLRTPPRPWVSRHVLRHMTEGPTATILVLVGSLRRASINKALAQVAIDQAPCDVRMRLFERLGELPLYNQDIDTSDVAEPVVAFRAAAAQADALLVVTPEYNGGIPGGLKNAIDWLSRPYGNSPMKGKPAAVIGASLSRYGGVWAHDEARKSLQISGLRVIESITVLMPTKTLDGRPPGKSPDLVRMMRSVVEDLAAEVPA